ncbi:tetratricopeptide repeat domain-containing protein [Cucurbitaria berberidis CBS 394.84]|uniref:Tetratricopeptide repeat domain-containing protein n=1 Tax=Cucurbitaria berberidis CBS 394.84 TaxID=1168544 RepID=A0A9P4GQT4_9PLEO|nr:tetratricopeptide repeat domain-containing protein [Cucurbitaria berberidis CBS 394.84]KAF1849642.1 tetratricopeptide repeat domain-containing protein [Cucurbitaria berberidis CBS 394.84]
MAEPVSIIAAGVGIADVAFRVISYLKDVQKAVESIEDDISGLINEVEGLKQVHGHLEQEFLKNITNDALGKEEKMLWFNTGQALQNGQKLVQKLEVSVRQIYGDSRSITGKRDGLMKQHRKRAKGGVISGFRDQIGTYHGALQIWLSCIDMYSTREYRENQTEHLKQLAHLMQELESKLEDTQLRPYRTTPASLVYNDFTSISLSVLNQIGKSINSLGNSVTHGQSNTNKHFDTPKPVETFYTGRAEQAEQLGNWILPQASQSKARSSEMTHEKQKRFVVYGVGGSGKTQFCCKFAEDNRDHFWGVFWVDGSSRHRLKQTFSHNVSIIGGVEANENAALHWLSNLSEPWLLIIDNADDPDLKLDEYFPRGNRGHVLITTRDPVNKSFGTVGNRFFEFQGLNKDEASCLLLNAAGQIQPWSSAMSNVATTIAKTLGYLALAITQAGKTIRQGYCKIHEYLDFYERQWIKTRQRRLAVKERDAVDNLSVITTFELNRQAIINIRDKEASRDALQLLNTFAFLHNQNIRFDMLRRAITNSKLESIQQEEDKGNEAQSRATSPPPDWSTWWKETSFKVLAFIYKNRSPLVLPSVIRAGRISEDFDSDRLRLALRQLTRFSLISHSEITDSYSIHPLVHKWARERPDMSIAEQGVWSEAAATLLAHCILIPPLGNTIEDEGIRKYLLPHIDHVHECQTSIDQRMRDKRMARMRPWPVFEGGFNREKALMYAKFSIVYAQNGRWEEAKRLQVAVKDFTMQVLGLQNAITRRITLALAGTLYNLGQSDDAAALHEQVLDACMAHMGTDHHDTLVAKCTLGDSRYLQGRFSDAKKLQEEAVAGLTELHGLHHEDTLNAIDCLGRTVLMFYTEDSIKKARELHFRAIDGMKTVHGDDHLRTLIACENLCATAVRSGDQAHLNHAHEMMNEVVEIRKEKLGREHGYTLLAMTNLALIKSGLGNPEDAEELILVCLPIAERNLGIDHHACLWGRYHLGKIWVQQKRWGEAEQQLVDVTERQRNLLGGRGQYHPDRLGGLVELAAIYNALGKVEECKRVVAEALHGFERISTTEHPVAKKLRGNMEKWMEERRKKDGTHLLTST